MSISSQKNPTLNMFVKRWPDTGRVGGRKKRCGNISQHPTAAKITSPIMIGPKFPILFNITTNRPAAVLVVLTSKREPTSVCVNVGNSTVRFIRIMNIVEFTNIGGSWIDEF